MRVPVSPTDALICESPAMQSVRLAIEELSQETAPVLIEGEPGTGRELIARLLHLCSARADRELHSIRAGGTPAEVVAFPFATQWERLAAADGGTLLVRDIVQLPKSSQRKLSRLLAPTAADPGTGAAMRVLATSDPGLGDAVECGMFYEPLHRKMSARTIVVPPLRERREDVLPLMTRLVHALAKSMGRRRLTVSSRASDSLLRYPWPGNVAELKQVARRLVVRAKGERIEVTDVDAVLPCLTARAPLEELSFEDLVRLKLAELFKRVEGYPLSALHEEVLGLVERPLLQLVLEHTGNNQLKAAEILGVSRNTLRRRLLDFGLLAERASPLRARRSPRASAAGEPTPLKKSRGR